jgi:hypothetical protein
MRFKMSPSEPIVKRKLIVDADTPGTEIFITDSKGALVGEGIRKLEVELPPALYKIKCRVGDRVSEILIELAPGQNPFYAPLPPLPIVSPAPAVSPSGLPPDQTEDFAQSLIAGPPLVHGSGGSLFVFVSPDQQSATPPEYASGALSVRRFNGELIADLKDAPNQTGCAGFTVRLDPGRYLLRVILDAGPPVEQTVFVAWGWQTRVYLQLIESATPASETTAKGLDAMMPGKKIDLPHMGVIMVADNRDAGLNPDDSPSPADLRWTAAARQALAARRSGAAPNREMMYALLQGKFRNPMLGIYAGHLLAMQESPDLGLLGEVYSNLHGLVGEHPDVEALLVAMKDPRAQSLVYQEPPMLYSSWALILKASTVQHDLRPERSYSARIAASLWGSGAWLSWRMPSPDTVTSAGTAQPSPGSLQLLIDEASAGRLDTRLNDLVQRKEPLSATERVLAAQLFVMAKRLQFANELTADEDSSSISGRIFLPVYRRFVDSDLQKQTKERIVGDLDPKLLSERSGIPYSTMLDAASTLGQKLGLASPSSRSRFLGGRGD